VASSHRPACGCSPFPSLRPPPSLASVRNQLEQQLASRLCRLQ
jgi:hypothetical protein